MHGELVSRVLRDRRKGILGWATGIVGIIAIQVSVYPTIRESQQGWSELTKQFPEAFQKIFRMSDYTSVSGYLSTELFSFVLPLIFVGVGATWGARAAAEEEEDGTADVLMSLPVTRRSLLLSRTTAALGVLVTLASLAVVALRAGTAVFDMSIGTVDLVNSALALLLLGSVFAVLALAVGAATGRRGIALGTSIATAIASFVFYSLAPLVGTFDAILPLNPFQWTLGNSPLIDGLDPWYSFVAITVTAAMAVLAVAAFDRRDIRS